MAFYDVAHQLCAPVYVRFHLIRAVNDEGETFLDNHRLWKLVGYTLGLDALDQLLDHSADGKEVFKVGGVAAWLFQQTRSVLQRKQFIAATNLSTEDQKNVAILLRMLLHESHSQGESDDQPLTDIEQAVNAMLQELPWCKGAEFTPEPVRKWDERAVELQSDELLLLAAGEKLPHLEVAGQEKEVAKRGLRAGGQNPAIRDLMKMCDAVSKQKNELGRPQAAQLGILWRILHGRDDRRT